jgi:hypothetical protein
VSVRSTVEIVFGDAGVALIAQDVLSQIPVAGVCCRDR